MPCWGKSGNLLFFGPHKNKASMPSVDFRRTSDFGCSRLDSLGTRTLESSLSYDLRLFLVPFSQDSYSAFLLNSDAIICHTMNIGSHNQQTLTCTTVLCLLFLSSLRVRFKRESSTVLPRISVFANFLSLNASPEGAVCSFFFNFLFWIPNMLQARGCE